MRRKSEEKAPESVADELLQDLTKTMQARTEVERDRVNAERDRERELHSLRGDMQSVVVGMGEIVGKIDNITSRVCEMDRLWQKGNTEMREDNREIRRVMAQLGVLVEKLFSGWTRATIEAEAQGVSVPKPPGYDLGEGGDET